VILVKWVRAFAMFWYDFIVGDDWLLAVGVIVALGLTALLAHVAKVPSWWLLPVAVLGVIVLSTARAARKAFRRASAARVESVTPAQTVGSAAATTPVQAVGASEQPAD